MEIKGSSLCGLDENLLNMKQEWLEQCCLPWGYGHTAVSACTAASSFPNLWLDEVLGTLSVLGVYFRIIWMGTPGIAADSSNAGIAADSWATDKTWVRVLLHKLGEALKKSHSDSLELFTAAGDTK